MGSCGVVERAEKTVSKARLLAGLTVGYNLLEGAVSVYFGVSDDSISLLGFGVDSFIEVASAVIVLLKLGQTDPDSNLRQERRATFSIGVLFLVLSASVIFSSSRELYLGSRPETTIPGVLISLLSLSFMFYLWRAKERVGKELDSSTVMADARCSLACIKLSFVLLLGSGIYWLAPVFWWADGAAALVLGVLIFREGKELIENSRKVDFKGGCGCS